MFIEYDPGKGNYNKEVEYYVTEEHVRVMQAFLNRYFPGPGKVFVKGSSYEARVDATPEVLRALIKEFSFLKGEVFQKSNGYQTLRLDPDSEFRKSDIGLGMRPVEDESKINKTLNQKLNEFFS